MSISGERAVVDLYTCIGEPVERLESEDPAVIGYLRTATGPGTENGPQKVTHMTPETMTPTGELAFPFLRANERPPNGRRGVTETRRPCYSGMGPRYLPDVLDAMGEHERTTEQVTSWRTDVVATIAREPGLEDDMCDAADPEVFGWYVKNYGPRSTSSSTTHRSSSSSACAAKSGAPRASGAASSPTPGG